MSWQTWLEDVEGITMEKMGMELSELSPDREDMRRCWKAGWLPEQYVEDRLSSHQEREEFDPRLEM